MSRENAMGDNQPEADDKGTLDDPAVQKAIFVEAYEQTRFQLDNSNADNEMFALGRINTAKNQAVDDAAADFSAEAGAECASGCAFCCHQMVLSTPLEIFGIVRHIVDTKTDVEIAGIKERLTKLTPLPLDERSRRGSDKPCALLENNCCSVYEHRPSLCRTMLSTSRAACETGLMLPEPAIPFISEPVVLAFLMQLGIDYALFKLKGLSTEKVELSRGLAIALDNFDVALANWLDGQDAFPNCHIELGNAQSNHELAQLAATQFGIA